MKRLPILLIMSIALVGAGCNEQATDVDTAPPEDDSAVRGYRGEPAGDETQEADEMQTTTPPPEDTTPQPILDEATDEQLDQQEASERPPQPQPGQEADGAADEEPAVEEVPADSIPEGTASGGEQEQNGSGS